MIAHKRLRALAPPFSPFKQVSSQSSVEIPVGSPQQRIDSPQQRGRGEECPPKPKGPQSSPGEPIPSRLEIRKELSASLNLKIAQAARNRRNRDLNNPSLFREPSFLNETVAVKGGRPSRSGWVALSGNGSPMPRLVGLAPGLKPRDRDLRRPIRESRSRVGLGGRLFRLAGRERQSGGVIARQGLILGCTGLRPLLK